ncbi:MAG: hypothetical protein IPK95_04830 [Cellvibrionales bacterium]|nr:hypothetical protein [Cellvibrionales bacterium]
MPRIPLAWKMLLREWRGGELGLLFASLVLGVTLVTGISLFAERLQKALVGEASVYLGADRVLQVADPVNPDWLEAAQQQGLSIARTTLFPTMIYPVSADSDRAVLSALKAVSAGYPLHGDLALRDGNDQLETVQHGPTKGMAWVDSNILAQLDIKIGEPVDIGNSRFIVERVLTREGDAGSSFYGMGARVMISDSDLPATGLIIPGSRVEYRYLFAGESTALDSYFDWLTPQLGKGYRVITLQDNQPGIAGALDKAGLFLRLAGSLGVLLAALAAAFAAQRYCERHTDTVAVLKTLGAGRTQVLGLLAGQMACLWLLATLAGFLLGILPIHHRSSNQHDLSADLCPAGFLAPDGCAALACAAQRHLRRSGLRPQSLVGVAGHWHITIFVQPQHKTGGFVGQRRVGLGLARRAAGLGSVARQSGFEQAGRKCLAAGYCQCATAALVVIAANSDLWYQLYVASHHGAAAGLPAERMEITNSSRCTQCIPDQYCPR